MKQQLIPLIAIFSVSVAGQVQAQEINIQALQACSLIDNDFKRLMCYDNTIAGKSLSQANVEKAAQAANSQTASKVAAATATTAVAAEQVIKTKNEDFGLEHKEVAKDNDDEITAVVQSVKKAPYGELIIKLDNNQTWRQIGSDRMTLQAQDTVVIERGVFNSFLLKIEGQNRSIRVKRTD